MKKIEAIIRPSRVDELGKSLEEIGVSGMTVLEVKGFGRQKGHTEVYRGTGRMVEFLPKARVVLAVLDDAVPAVIERILTVARSGRIGDGKIFVYDLEETVRIRTGDRGTEAL